MHNVTGSTTHNLKLFLCSCFQPFYVEPDYEAAFNNESFPCEWNYVFGELDDGCWTFDAFVNPLSAPGAGCSKCEWRLTYCEKGAVGNNIGRDFLFLSTGDHYSDGKMEGLCGNKDGNPTNDNDVNVCKCAKRYLDPLSKTLPENCITDPPAKPV